MHLSLAYLSFSQFKSYFHTLSKRRSIDVVCLTLTYTSIACLLRLPTLQRLQSRFIPVAFKYARHRNDFCWFTTDDVHTLSPQFVF